MVNFEQAGQRHERPSGPADDAVRETRFENPRLSALGIEPMRLSELRARVPSPRLAQPERIDFYLLMLVTKGTGRHVVDFEEGPLAPGSLVFVRPGQVQQWRLPSTVEAELVLVAPAALPQASGIVVPREVEALALDDWPPVRELEPDHATEIEADLARLRRDFERFEPTDLDVALIRHRLLIVLVRLARLHREHDRMTHEAADRRVIYRSFRRELEAHFADNRSLRFYAKRLGYAESTVSRACLAAEGRSAKQVIDRRVALEAQRLLVHSTATVAEIAHRVGFSEATNFVKFFRRQTGRTPQAFRREAVPSRGSGERLPGSKSSGGRP